MPNPQAYTGNLPPAVLEHNKPDRVYRMTVGYKGGKDVSGDMSPEAIGVERELVRGIALTFVADSYRDNEDASDKHLSINSTDTLEDAVTWLADFHVISDNLSARQCERYPEEYSLEGEIQIEAIGYVSTL
tara:strand:- start:10012 stop:10404 length:393 start_codon:yes stop_codon:yes gene_type:complete